MAAAGTSSGRFLTSHFLVGVIILAVAAFLSGPVATWSDLSRKKLPLPLKKPLEEMSDAGLAPFRVIGREELLPTVIEALDTSHYAILNLEDTGVPADDPLRFARLFVTYYSTSEHLVLHTPDVCALGAGYKPAQPHENTTISVENVGAVPLIVPVRVCTFVSTNVFGGNKNSIIYTFHCNGSFVSSATRIRLMINDPRTTYAYFSKVEVSFPRATREESVQGAGKLLARVLPVLIRDHWPDFERAEREANEPAEGTVP